MRDYEVLRRELPGDNEVSESLSQAQAALSKSQEEAHHVKFDVEEVSGVEQFKTAISSPGKPSCLPKKWTPIRIPLLPCPLVKT